MNPLYHRCPTKPHAICGQRWPRGFTLIELLVVIAIITLLISILLPTLSGAREQGMRVKSRAIMKAIGEGAEMYSSWCLTNSDNEMRVRNGYPPSAEGENPTEDGTQDITGAHWIALYLMGKDGNGYAHRNSAGMDLQDPGNVAEQVSWYEFDADGDPIVDRLGPYAEGLKMVQTKNLPQAGDNPSIIKDQEEKVFVDAFGYPILYYVADAMQAQRPKALVATYGVVGSGSGIYNFRDNGLFTGQCQGTLTSPQACSLPKWDFGAGTDHVIEYFGPNPADPDTIRDAADCFQYYILNHELYLSSPDPDDPVAKPHRTDSFILISAGKDARYGTNDDVNNF